MIKELTNQELDNFLSSQKYSQFLQSSSWNGFQKQRGNRVWQIGIVENDRILAAVSVIEKKLILNMGYLYAARGPIVSDEVNDKLKYLKLILKAVRDITISTTKNSEIFFRFEPLFLPKGIENLRLIKSCQPSNTLLLDLNKSLEQLLSEIHQKTRYNIRLAKKKGIKIERMEDYKKGIKYFWDLMKQTFKRDNFRPHPRSYYKKLLEIRAGNACLWLAKYNDEVLITHIVTGFGNTVAYIHGASSNKHRNLMAPHLLQWEQIKWAKDNGYKIYDFWGIAKNDNPKDKWAGLTRFKKGFGGGIKNLPGTFDLVYNQRMYKLYKFLKKFV